MIYSLRSLLSESLDDLAAGRSVLPDDADAARLEMRRRAAREGFLAARRLTVPQKTPSDEVFHQIISKAAPSDSFTVDPVEGGSATAECNVFVHSATHLTSADIDNKLISSLKRVFGQPLYTDDDGYPVWQGQPVWVPIFYTLKRGIVRYLRNGEVIRRALPGTGGLHQLAATEFDPHDDARMALSDDPANIHGLQPSFFNEQESPNAYDTIATLPDKREYDITKIELQEWKTIFSVSTMALFFGEDEEDLDPDMQIPIESNGTIQIDLNKRILTIPTGRKRILS